MRKVDRYLLNSNETSTESNIKSLPTEENGSELVWELTKTSATKLAVFILEFCHLFKKE